MTTILHLDSETTESLRYRMRRTAEDLYDSTGRLYGTLALADWQGSSREEMLDALYRLHVSLRQQSEQLDQLAFRLRAEIEQWQTAASSLRR